MMWSTKKDARQDWHLIKRLCDIFAVGDFLEFVAGFGQKLVCLGLRFLAPGFCHSCRGENAAHE
jgi:hypothetical protein